MSAIALTDHHHCIGFIETNSIAKGIEATDAMMTMADLLNPHARICRILNYFTSSEGWGCFIPSYTHRGPICASRAYSFIWLYEGHMVKKGT